MAEEATTFSEPAARDVTLAVRRSTFGKCPACGLQQMLRTVALLRPAVSEACFIRLSM